MNLSRLLFFVGILFSLNGLHAQDIHYTLFNMSPLSTNPALTGAFNGSIRVGGIYRSQFYTISNYTTPSFYADAPVLRGFRDNDWIGVGIMFLSDQAGDINKLTTSVGGLSASYHLALNKKGTSVLTLGGQYGSVTRKFEAGQFVSENTIQTALGGGGLSNDDDIEGMGGGGMGQGGERMKNFTDISAGLLFRTQMNDQAALELGFGMKHIGSPEYNIVGNTGGGQSGRDRPSTLVFHGQLDYELNDKWSIRPTFLFQTTAKQREISLQGWMSRRINPDVALNFGLGYRYQDAGKLLFGIDYKDLRAAVSYDFTLSSARNLTDWQGGPEISAYYIFKIYKKPTVTPKLLCPQF